VGLLVDRLAIVQHELLQLQGRLVAQGDTAGAVMQQVLIDRLQEVLLSVDGTAVDRHWEATEAAVEAAGKLRFPKSRGGKGIKKKGRRKPGRLVWICCGEPQRNVGRKGRPIWTAACQWRKGDVRGQTMRLVGTGSSKPSAVVLKGRKMKKCNMAQEPENRRR